MDYDLRLRLARLEARVRELEGRLGIPPAAEPRVEPGRAPDAEPPPGFIIGPSERAAAPVAPPSPVAPPVAPPIAPPR
ncbi:MAG: hypothetical protein WD749_14630, partial [Phycisphaerales bacterium]